MKVNLKVFEGEVQAFHTLVEAEKYLNTCLYYADKVYLQPSFEDWVDYREVTSLKELVTESRLYGDGIIKVIIVS